MIRILGSRGKVALPVVLAVLGVALSSVPAKATTVDYSFTDTIGGVSGTVTVAIAGLTDGTTGAASSVTLLSYPSALNPEIAAAGTNLTAWTYQDVNSFTLNAAGNLVAEDFDVASCPSGCNGGADVDVFTLDSITPLPPEPAAPSPIDFLGYGAYEAGLGTGPYPNAVAATSGAVVSTPEPSTASLMLIGFGLLGGMMLARKRIAPALSQTI